MVFQCSAQGLQSVQCSLDLHEDIRCSGLWTLKPLTGPMFCKGNELHPQKDALSV